MKQNYDETEKWVKCLKKEFSGNKYKGMVKEILETVCETAEMERKDIVEELAKKGESPKDFEEGKSTAHDTRVKKIRDSKKILIYLKTIVKS